jgi:hypothetical protein
VQDKDVASPQAVQVAVDAARAQHQAFVLALVLPQVRQTAGARWMALGILNGLRSDETMTAETK